MRYSSAVIGFCLASILSTISSAQDLRVEAPQYRVAKENNEKVIVISFRTNFLADRAIVDAVTTDARGKVTAIPSADIPVKNTGNVVTPPRSTFEARISYDAQLPQATSLKVNIRAWPPASTTGASGDGGAAAPSTSNSPSPAAPEASATAEYDTQPIRSYFEDQDHIDDLKAQVAKLVPPPTITIEADVLTVTDRSIKLHARSKAFARVRAYAYQTTDVNRATGDTDLKSSVDNLYDDVWHDLVINGLSEHLPYIVVVRETDKPQDRAAAAVLASYQGQPLATLDQLPRPYVAFDGPPRNKKNRTIVLRIRTRNVAKVRATVFNDTTLDKPEIVRDAEVAVTQSQNAIEVPLQLPSPLGAGQTYRVIIRGIAANSLIDPTETTLSDPVAGLPEQLFESIAISATANALKFTPNNAPEPITMVVVTTVSGVTSSVACPDVSKCEFPVASFPSAVQPGSASAPAQLQFEVTASAKDGSERSSVAKYVFTPAAGTPSVTTAAKQTAQNFVTGLLTDTNQNSGIQAKHIKGSAVATYVAVFLKAFFGLP
jgi:hypothetical protein